MEEQGSHRPEAIADHDHPIPLDYSSPVEERKREQSSEDERRTAIENYNQSTYGERHPFFRGPIARCLLYLLILCLMAAVLPRWLFRWMRYVAVGAVLLWECIRVQ